MCAGRVVFVPWKKCYLERLLVRFRFKTERDVLPLTDFPIEVRL